MQNGSLEVKQGMVDLSTRLDPFEIMMKTTYRTLHGHTISVEWRKERLADASLLSAYMGERSRQKFRVTRVHAGKVSGLGVKLTFPVLRVCVLSVSRDDQRVYRPADLSAYPMAHTPSLPQALSEGFIPPSWPDPKFERYERFLIPMLDAFGLGHLHVHMITERSALSYLMRVSVCEDPFELDVRMESGLIVLHAVNQDLWKNGRRFKNANSDLMCYMGRRFEQVCTNSFASLSGENNPWEAFVGITESTIFDDNTAYTFLMLPEFDAFHPSHTPACAPTEEEVTERHGTLPPSFQRGGLEALFAAPREPASGGLFGNFSKDGQVRANRRVLLEELAKCPKLCDSVELKVGRRGKGTPFDSAFVKEKILPTLLQMLLAGVGHGWFGRRDRDGIVDSIDKLTIAEMAEMCRPFNLKQMLRSLLDSLKWIVQISSLLRPQDTFRITFDPSSHTLSALPLTLPEHHRMPSTVDFASLVERTKVTSSRE
ncbi:putative RAT1-interacting protein [Blattamonas nauphoetae]|uniref:Decapping nuclease n=1 Tax=Blattamonas nauphoetae TaxID=2049346 RepID=A0ABQ9XNW2_9EUKA|nr:putative RAT1-interacting protein [Blattamonas nauphoetae]